MMSEQSNPETPKLRNVALAISTLLFVGIYVWGLIMSINEMTQKSAAPPSGPG